MALYSPAYIASRITQPHQGSIFFDYEHNFTINLQSNFTTTVYNTNNQPSRSHIEIRNLEMFKNISSALFDFISISINGWVSIKRNSIISYVPINPVSMINAFDMYYAICLSQEYFATTPVYYASSTVTLANLFIANNTNINSLLKYTIFQSDYSPFIGASSPLQKNAMSFKYEIPLNYKYSQYAKGFYLYLIFGIGQPNYGIDLDNTAGNGLLDCEFTRFTSSAVLPGSYIFSLPGTNYGSYQVNASNTIAAGNAKITNWYYTINCQLYGKILS